MKKIVFIILSLLILLGCGHKNNKVEIKIGVLLPLTGNLATYGTSAKEGIDIAVSSINDTSKIKIATYFEDTRGIPKDAVNAYLKLKSSIDNLVAILGPQTSSEVLSIAPICEKDKMVLLSHAASSPQITNAGDYIFRNVPSDYYEAVVLADYIIDSTEYRDLAVLYVNDDYGNGVVSKFSDELIKKGGKIVTSISYNTNSTDFKTQLTKIKSYKPQAIYIIGFKELGHIVKQTKELNINVQIYSNALFEDPDNLKIAGSSANNVIFTTFYFDTESNEPRIKDFVKNYKAKYNKIPDGFAATAYDAVFLLYEAAKNDTNSEQVKNELIKIKDFPGLLGKLTFDSNGDVTLPIQLKTVKDNNFVKLNSK